MNLSELADNQYLKALIYGPSGVGKTCFLSGAPGKTYVFDFDNKISSLASYLKHTNKEKLALFNYSSFVQDPTQKMRPMQRFDLELKALEEAFASGKATTSTICLDSLTTFSEELMREIMISNPGIKGPAPGVPGMQHYMVLAPTFKNYMARILALPVNVIVIAHMSLEKDEQTGAIVGKPLLSGKLADALPVVFPEIYRAFVESKDGKAMFALQTRADGRHITRTQIPGLAQAIPNSFEYILSKLNQGEPNA